MYRDIEKTLEKWKNKSNKKPLIIKGMRQVGKTYSIRKFGQANYDYVIEINLERSAEYRNLFENTSEPKEILSYIEASNLNINLRKGNILLFIDEIQAAPKALTTLKFLSEESPYDIICSGSMLGIAIAHTSSYPVGYVETIEMFPMTFLEFLKALGSDEIFLNNIKSNVEKQIPLNKGLHEKMNEYFKNYIVCGGMPEVVSTFIDTHSIKEVIERQRSIVNGYYSDMAKYASGSEKIKVHECYASLPLQLAKENKKFQYKMVKKGYNARYYDAALQWLIDSGLIIKVNRLKAIDKPLEAYVELPIFKIYMSDTGLLISQFDDGVIKDILTGNIQIFKGVLYENIVAQMLHSFNKKTYYFEPNTSSEIDFIFNYEGEITPLEVKAGLNTRSTSFNLFVEKYKPKQSFRCSQKELGIGQNGTVYLPLYELPFVMENEKDILDFE